MRTLRGHGHRQRLGAGLRRAEVVGLNIGDYESGERRLRVRGKRNKQRSLPIVAGAASALDAFICAKIAYDKDCYRKLLTEEVI